MGKKSKARFDPMRVARDALAKDAYAALEKHISDRAQAHVQNLRFLITGLSKRLDATVNQRNNLAIELQRTQLKLDEGADGMADLWEMIWHLQKMADKLKAKGG